MSSTIQLVSESGAQHGGYMASKLWVELEKDTNDKQPLIQVSTWTIGEFGDMLLQQSDDHAIIVRKVYFILYLFFNFNTFIGINEFLSINYTVTLVNKQ